MRPGVLFLQFRISLEENVGSTNFQYKIHISISHFYQPTETLVPGNTEEYVEIQNKNQMIDNFIII